LAKERKSALQETFVTLCVAIDNEFGISAIVNSSLLEVLNSKDSLSLDGKK
jgi:hypothetical protein